MNGLECLQEELKKRGFNITKVKDSKMVPAILDILANTGTLYCDIQSAKQDLGSLKYLYSEQEKEYNRRKEAYQHELEKMQEEMDKIYEYVETFDKSLKQCETAEGRDAMRAAQVFVNTVEVNSKYDNTAFIIGLSSILAKGGIGPIDELKKVNPKLFDNPSTERY